MGIIDPQPRDVAVEIVWKLVETRFGSLWDLDCT